jgi:hypothetical protein
VFADQWAVHAGIANNGVKGQAAGEVRQCDACGEVGHLGIDAVSQGMDIWLCAECARVLPAEEIERLTSEIALRGVPWS